MTPTELRTTFDDIGRIKHDLINAIAPLRNAGDLGLQALAAHDAVHSLHNNLMRRVLAETTQ